MYGLRAIGEANGWSMAVLGISIVFSGLVALSIIIAQLHKILGLWENWQENRKSRDTRSGSGASEKYGKDAENVCHHPHLCPTDIHEIAQIWEPLALQLNSPFCLADLHELAKKYDYPHPHLSINRLRNEHILVPVGDCLFEWHTEAN